MNAREDILHGLRQLDESQPGDLTPEQLVDAYRAEVLNEAADKLALELAPEQPGAGPGFLLALRIAMRNLRRMADEAAAR